MNNNEQISTRAKGNIGEDAATEFLVQNGYKILKRNFNFGKSGEIDIIALDGNIIVFVEVKTRSKNSPYGDALFSITPQKQKHIRKAAEGYLYVNKMIDRDCRIDVITIETDSGKNKIEHLTNVM